MSKIGFALVIVGSLLIAGFALHRESAVAAAGPCNPANADISGPEQQLFAGVNAWRMSNYGVPAMQLSAPANKAAQWYAEQTVLGLTNPSYHLDAYNRNQIGRLQDCGYDPYWSGGSGEALAFVASDTEALAWITNPTPGHQNGVQAQVPWQCAGVGFASNSGAGGVEYAWVVVVAQYGSSDCPQPVTGPPPGSTLTPGITVTATNTPTSTPTMTPTPMPTATANYNTQITLMAGWNLVTLPAGPLGDILDTASQCFSAVYQADGDHWLRYVLGAPAYANNLSLSSGGAFWILGTETNCGIVRI